MALVLYAILAVLSWFTLDGKIRLVGRLVELRLLPLLIIGGLALRTVLAMKAERIRRQGERDDAREGLRIGGINRKSWIVVPQVLRADVAQLVEHSLGKGEVTSSILVISSRNAVNSCQ